MAHCEEERRRSVKDARAERMLQRNRAAWAEENSRARKRDAALQSAEGAAGARKSDAEEDTDGVEKSAKKKRRAKRKKQAAQGTRKRQQRHETADERGNRSH